MKVVVVGAGSVGRSVSERLLRADHEVTLVDSRPHSIRVSLVPDADWVLADACSPDALEQLGARECDALVAVTGDDKVNLVVSLIAKTIFGVPKVIARANHTSNEWMYNSNWGVDVLASTPRALTSLVEEAVAVGQSVELLALDQTGTSVYTLELPSGSAVEGLDPSEVLWPEGLVVAAVTRNNEPRSLRDCGELRSGDQLIVVCGRGRQAELMEMEDLIAIKRR